MRKWIKVQYIFTVEKEKEKLPLRSARPSKLPVKAGMSELDIFVKAEADLVFNGEETPEDMINKLYEEQKKYR